MMTSWKLAPALAAGCTVVLKPDPATPLSALRLAELAVEVGIPAGVINIVPGDGPTTGAHLVTHPGMDKVAFTGSTRTGSEIMRLCAEPVKRVSLELGGKSPNIFFADADLDAAIPSSVYAVYYAAGQSCDARSRVFVEKPVYDEVVNGFAKTAGRMKTGDPLDEETQMGSLISQAHRDKVHGFVEAGREEGVEVVTGGHPLDGDGAFYPATVLAKVDNTMSVAQEEIFGPVVSVIPFEDEAEAVRLANDVQYGLVATVWTGDPARGHRLARQIKAGTIGINCPNTAFPGLPFGGYKQSGFGRENALETLEMYLETEERPHLDGREARQPMGPLARVVALVLLLCRRRLRVGNGRRGRGRAAVPAALRPPDHVLARGQGRREPDCHAHLRPDGGTHPDPAKACAALDAHPEALHPVPGTRHARRSTAATRSPRSRDPDVDANFSTARTAARSRAGTRSRPCSSSPPSASRRAARRPPGARGRRPGRPRAGSCRGRRARGSRSGRPSRAARR